MNGVLLKMKSVWMYVGWNIISKWAMRFTSTSGSGSGSGGLGGFGRFSLIGHSLDCFLFIYLKID